MSRVVRGGKREGGGPSGREGGKGEVKAEERGGRDGEQKRGGEEGRGGI